MTVTTGLPELLDLLERYLDAVPRTEARAENHGSLTLFIRDGGGYPYYARPRLGYTGAVTGRDVTAVCARQRHLGLPETVEFIREVAPTMTAAARSAGLHVTEHPLLVLDTDRIDPAAATAAPTADPRVCLLGGHSQTADIATAQAVARIGFSSPGTAVGPEGVGELAAVAADVSVAEVTAVRERLRQGYTVTATAVRDGVTVGVGSHQPVGAVTEIVGVATLPAARRGGVGSAVTRVLAADALARGCTTVFLSAGDESVARIYQRIGFRRVATSCIGQTG